MPNKVAYAIENLFMVFRPKLFEPTLAHAGAFEI
jgi:hypothetical protein